MVNTRVKDPLRRQLNRKLDRQKKGAMRANKKLVYDPHDLDALRSLASHRIKTGELKSKRIALKH
jgi:hypothetical protein